MAIGETKGTKVIVKGKHGGIEHVLVDFQSEVLEKLVLGDRILVKAYGIGLKLLDFHEIKVLNIDPCLLEAWNPQPVGGKLEVLSRILYQQRQWVQV